MKIAGANTLALPVQQVWNALLDPRVLVATIPGCLRLEETGEHAYAMTVTAGVAAIKGTYDGTCSLSDLVEHESLVMRLRGAGGPGTVEATVNVSFEDTEGGTRIGYEADAVVGGMVGGVGQRMLASVSKRMAGEFFDNVGRTLQGRGDETLVETGLSTSSADGGRPVFTAATTHGGISSQDDFLKGIAVGAGLVLLGLAAGSVLGRRR